MTGETLRSTILKFFRAYKLLPAHVRLVSLTYYDDGIKSIQFSFDDLLRSSRIEYNKEKLNNGLTIVMKNGDVIVHDSNIGFYLIKIGTLYPVKKYFDKRFLSKDYEVNEIL